MITIRFNDRDIDHRGNPKSARAWLRKNGLSIRDGRKETSELWVFDGNCPVTVPKTNPVQRPERVKASVEIAIRSKEVTQAEVDAATAIVQRQLRKIENLPVPGSDLEPGDVLVEFIPNRDLTIDWRGLQEIVHEAENITKQTQSYMGFYSEESRGTASFKIDPKRIYDVKRGIV